MQINLSPKDVAELMQPYSQKDREGAMKLGFVRFMSENGIDPELAEKALQKVAFPKLAEGGFFNAVSTLPSTFLTGIKDYGLAMTLPAAALGAASGVLRHRGEQAAKGMDDPDVNKLHNRLSMYQKMKQELMNNRSAEGNADPELSEEEKKELQSSGF